MGDCFEPQEFEMDIMDIYVRVLLIGIGATLLVDLWGVFLRKAFGVRSLSYAMVGRWLGHMWDGRFAHPNITTTPAVRGENAVGWSFHYIIGILFAGLLVAVTGDDWLDRPSIGPALVVGVGTVIAPFFVMQPGMGFGIAASRTPAPGIARLRSLVTHGIFGLGLYGAAWLLAQLVLRV
jgi:hypothetical protein